MTCLHRRSCRGAAVLRVVSAQGGCYEIPDWMTYPAVSQWAVREVQRLPLPALSAVRDLIAAFLDDLSGTQGGTANAARPEPSRLGPLFASPPAVRLRESARRAAQTTLAELIAAVPRPGSFTSVAQLRREITTYLAERNENPKPYGWTAKGEETLEKIHRARQALRRQEEQKSVEC